MLVSYHWEKMKVNVECNNQKSVSPHTKTVVRDVDYEYEVVIKVRDIVDYLMPYNLSHKKNKTQEEVNETRLAVYYMKKMFNFLQDNSALDLDELENDDYFKEFMHDRYKESALEEWEKYNDAY